MRLQFVLSDLWVGLRRNLTMTVAMVVTIAIALTMFGTGLLLRKQVDVMKGYWYDKIEVSIFLCGTSSSPTGVCHGTVVSQAESDQLDAQLHADPLVAKVYYESQQQAYQRFKQDFKSSPEVVQNVSPDVLPESYRVKLKDATKYDVVASEYQGRPGVEEVVDQRRLLDRFFRVLNRFQAVALAIAVTSLVAALLLIGNLVRVAAFTRRRETGIMRLVGASNLYIQLPFLLEGVVAGLVGSAVSVGVLALLKYYLIDSLLRKQVSFTEYIGWDSVLQVVPIVVAVGVGLAALASLVSLRRFLRV